MWQNFYEQLVEKLQTLADDFGRELRDFLNGLKPERALCWEASLQGFLHDWRQRGILVDEKECRKLFKLLGGLREKHVPADELRAMRECWQRHIKDRQDHPGPMQLGEPTSPEEALLPAGVRELGHGIMRRHPIERWLFVADDVLSSWRFAEGMGAKFRAWMAAEQRANSPRPMSQRTTLPQQTPPHQTATLPQANPGQHPKQQNRRASRTARHRKPAGSRRPTPAMKAPTISPT